MKIIGDYLRVKELQKDFKVDGLLEKYDDNSPYMFAKVIEAEESIMNYLLTYTTPDNLVVLFKRPAKIPFLGSYLVDRKDIIAIMTKEEFDKM